MIPGKLANESGNGLVFVSASELKIDKVINLYGNMVDKNNVAESMLQTSYNITTGLDVAVNMYYRKDEESIRYHYIDHGYYSGSTAYVVIEYTKK